MSAENSAFITDQRSRSETEFPRSCRTHSTTRARILARRSRRASASWCAPFQSRCSKQDRARRLMRLNSDSKTSKPSQITEAARLASVLTATVSAEFVIALGLAEPAHCRKKRQDVKGLRGLRRAPDGDRCSATQVESDVPLRAARQRERTNPPPVRRQRAMKRVPAESPVRPTGPQCRTQRSRSAAGQDDVCEASLPQPLRLPEPA